ncbi:CRISPR-associated protein Csx16 [Salinarimonas chemoclinalis]|uniref:CRISPR-associated protein Csx16 n=1 Tax=Salinarimonas chemoclinalis TaxID=3241599 RepID=UPI003558C895
MAEGRVLFVGRHPGALAWAARRGIVAEPVAHLDPTEVGPGDRVLGTLPVHVAAAIVARGARYTHLVLDLPADARGRDLDPDEMERFGARLVDYVPVPVAPAPLPGAPAPAAGEPADVTGGLWRRLRNRFAGWFSPLAGAALLGLGALAAIWLGSALEALAGALWPQGVAVPADAGFLEAMRLRLVDVFTPNLDAVAGAHALDAALAALFFGLVGLRLFIVGRRVLRTRITASIASPTRARSAVVMALSSMSAGELAQLASASEATLEAVCGPNAASAGWTFRWVQNLRALRHHLRPGRRLRVEVLVSKDSEGQLAAFRALATRLVAGTGATLEVRQAGRAVDYDDYRDVEAAVAQSLGALVKEGFAFGDICFDTTSGTKPISIACAVITMNRELEFSYVAQSGQVWLFDARLPLAWGGE